MSYVRLPVATYRIQFHLGFRFPDARDLVPYLDALGITDLYASPRFKARKGSSHGYDVTDPWRINSELGTAEEFEELAERLRHSQMGLRLDRASPHIFALARRFQQQWGLAVVPRQLSHLTAPEQPPLGYPVWGRSRLVLPAGASSRWRNGFTGEVLTATTRHSQRTLRLSNIFASFPVALLASDE